MTTVAGFNRKLKSLSILGEAKKTVATTTDKAKDLNVEQIIHGFNSDNSRIGRYRNPQYRSFKQSLNPLADGFVDLVLTGRSVGSIEARLDNNIIKFKMTDDRYSLISRYGKEVLGLSDDSLQEYIDFIEPLFIARVKKQLDL